MIPSPACTLPTSRRLGFSLLVALTAAITLVGCKPMVSTGVIVDSIRTEMLKQKLAVASIDCPEQREAKAGDTFECTATPQIGGKVYVQVTQTNDTGLMDWKVTRSEGLFDLDKAEAVIVAGVLEKGVEVAVDCGTGWVIADVGQTLECSVSTAAGEKRTAVITIDAADGSMSWRVR
jgi:hypothetical protein